MIQQPKNLPILKFLHVELRKLVLRSHHLVGQHTLGNLLEWPVTTGENLRIELDVLDQGPEVASSLRKLLLVVLHHLFGLEHIFKHGFDFIDGVVAALNL